MENWIKVSRGHKRHKRYGKFQHDMITEDLCTEHLVSELYRDELFDILSNTNNAMIYESIYANRFHIIIDFMSLYKTFPHIVQNKLGIKITYESLINPYSYFM